MNEQSLQDFDRLLDEVIANNPDALEAKKSSSTKESKRIAGVYDTKVISLRDIPKMVAFENTILSDSTNDWVRKQQIEIWRDWNSSSAMFKSENPWYAYITFFFCIE